MRDNALEVLTTLDPIALLVTYFAVAWVLMPLLRGRSGWLIALILAHPIVTFTRGAVADPTLGNVITAVLMVAVAIVFIIRPPPRDKARE